MFSLLMLLCLLAACTPAPAPTTVVLDILPIAIGKLLILKGDATFFNACHYLPSGVPSTAALLMICCRIIPW